VRRSAPHVRTAPSYLAFVLRAGAAPVAVPLGPAQPIDDLGAQWRRDIVVGALDGPDAAADAALRASGASLRRRIWNPVEPHLRDVGRVFVVPDGALNLVPLGALPVGKSSYLLETGPVIHYLSAERDLAATGADVAATGTGLLAIGGPAFDDATQSAARVTTSRASGSPRQVARAPTPPTTLFRGELSACANVQSLQFEALPASLREASEVGRLWREFGPAAAGEHGVPRVLVGRDASEQTLKQLGPGRRILHLATHGFFLGSDCIEAPRNTRGVGGLVAAARPRPRTSASENPLLLSGLALAGANRRAAAGPDEDDGILTAEEVASLNLAGVEWAVLSACDTGVGEVKAGEGVFGLRRAFRVAGARTVIMSLWPVEDEAARQWMRALYEAKFQRGMSTADAVRHAQVTMLNARRTRGQSTHPRHWAPFVAAGEWN
jgi:CHAT domain-containing protein